MAQYHVWKDELNVADEGSLPRHFQNSVVRWSALMGYFSILSMPAIILSTEGKAFCNLRHRISYSHSRVSFSSWQDNGPATGLRIELSFPFLLLQLGIDSRPISMQFTYPVSLEFLNGHRIEPESFVHC